MSGQQWEREIACVACGREDRCGCVGPDLPEEDAGLRTTCAHRVRHSFSAHNKHATHTIQCSKPDGHDGAHQWTDDDTGRSVVWFREGAPPDIDYSTRFRFSKDG